MRHLLPLLALATTMSTPAVIDVIPAFRLTNWQEGVLAKLPQTQVPFGLDLGDTDVTDAGLKELAGLMSPQSLNLGGPQVTDAGLKDLAGLKSLRTLDLSFTQVTDAGLKDLVIHSLPIES